MRRDVACQTSFLIRGWIPGTALMRQCNSISYSNLENLNHYDNVIFVVNHHFFSDAKSNRAAHRVDREKESIHLWSDEQKSSQKKCQRG